MIRKTKKKQDKIKDKIYCLGKLVKLMAEQSKINKMLIKQQLK